MGVEKGAVHSWSLVIGIVVACLMGATAAGTERPAHAQSPALPTQVADDTSLSVRVDALTPSVLRMSPAQRLASADRAVQAGAYRKAVEMLGPLVDRQPSFRDGPGAATYLLGRAYALQGDTARAHEAYRAGVSALMARGLFDLSLFEAYVYSVLDGAVDGNWPTKQREARAATEVYLKILGRAGPDASERVRRHAALTLLLRPDDRRSPITPDADALFDGRGVLRAGAGSRLQAWWRRQDPRPASPGNDRLFEHLRRVQTAQRRFEADTFLGFDDRGRVFVRLGAPTVRRSLSSGSVARSVSTDTHFMPRNEYWRYRGYGRYSHYLFVQRKKGFRHASVIDLLPPSLRTGSQGSGALTALVLRDFYDHLTPRIPEYAPLYDEMDDVVADLKMHATTRLTTATRLADTNFDPVSGRSRYVEVRQPFFQKARRIEKEVDARRDRGFPASTSVVAERAQTLPVAVRTARFLDDDGATEVEIYWSVRRHALETEAVVDALQRSGYAKPQGHILRMRAQRHRMNYRREHVAESQHRIRAHDEEQNRRDEPVVSMRLPGVTAPHHLSMQWDQFAIVGGATGQKAVQAQARSYWVDSLRVLPSGSNLVLSDLVPVNPDTYSSGRPLRTADGWTAEPYPFREIGAQAKVGLYFEVYHLDMTSEGRTRYTIEYVVTQTDVPQSRIARIFRNPDTQTTTTATSASGRTSTTREYVEIPLSDVTGADVVTLAVRVTDEVTGRTAERSLRFGRASEK